MAESVDNSGVTGPYQPSWKNRRLIVRVTLAWCGAFIPAVVFWGPDTAPAETAVWGACGIAVFLLGYYLIGPSMELVGLAKAYRPGK